MKLDDARILLTGAAGGIGSATALTLGRSGAKLLLSDLDLSALRALAAELESDQIDVEVLAANVAVDDDRDRLAERAADLDVDVLINIAGVNPFGWLANQSEAEIELAFRVNTIAPVLLCRAMLPVLAKRERAHIVNVGSAFGSIGFPGFAAYSASKFAIRGFSEALRRELADTRIRVHYVAPRATRTRLVTDRVRQMNEELRIAMDPPETVARAIARALERERRELAVGFPERLFAKVNGLLPGIVDRALARQLPTVRRYADVAASVATPTAAPPWTHQPIQERSR